MLQIIFSSCKEDLFEFVGRVTTFTYKYENGLEIKPSLEQETDSGCVVSFLLADVIWSWGKCKGFIDTLQHIARNNNLHVEVVGVSFN